VDLVSVMREIDDTMAEEKARLQALTLMR